MTLFAEPAPTPAAEQMAGEARDLAWELNDEIQGEQRNYFNVDGKRIPNEFTLPINTVICGIGDRMEKWLRNKLSATPTQTAAGSAEPDSDMFNRLRGCIDVAAFEPAISKAEADELNAFVDKLEAAASQPAERPSARESFEQWFDRVHPRNHQWPDHLRDGEKYWAKLAWVEAYAQSGSGDGWVCGRCGETLHPDWGHCEKFGGIHRPIPTPPQSGAQADAQKGDGK